MKAVAILPAKREIALIEVEPPGPVAPTQAKLRILDVGVCGTDREICSFQYETPPDGSEHLIIGHESLGEVVEIGSHVSGLKPVVFGSVNASRSNFQSAISDLTAFNLMWPASLSGLIAGRFAVEQYREHLLGPANGIKSVLSFAN